MGWKMKIKVKTNLIKFKNIFNILNNVGLESKMVFDTTGLTMYASHSNTTGAKVVFKKEFFDEYEINGEKEEFGIIINDIRKSIKSA